MLHYGHCSKFGTNADTIQDLCQLDEAQGIGTTLYEHDAIALVLRPAVSPELCALMLSTRRLWRHPELAIEAYSSIVEDDVLPLDYRIARIRAFYKIFLDSDVMVEAIELRHVLEELTGEAPRREP